MHSFCHYSGTLVLLLVEAKRWAMQERYDEAFAASQRESNAWARVRGCPSYFESRIVIDLRIHGYFQTNTPRDNTGLAGRSYPPRLALPAPSLPLLSRLKHPNSPFVPSLNLFNTPLISGNSFSNLSLAWSSVLSSSVTYT